MTWPTSSMMTAAHIVDKANAHLHGWGTTTDRLTPLKFSIGPTDTTFTVDFASGAAAGISPGVVEIGSEQILVVGVDNSTGVCTVANGFGRGHNGTTAASHAAGAKITTRPKFPRKWIFEQLNAVVSSVYPKLFKVNLFETTATFPVNEYTLPVSTPTVVLDAEWQDVIGNWYPIRSYRFDSYSGKFRLFGTVQPGRPIRITYGTEPLPFASEASTLASTGLPASCADVLELGTVAALVPGLDISRAQLTSIEQTDRSRDIPASAALQAGTYITREYMRRLGEESRALRKQFRPRVVHI